MEEEKFKYIISTLEELSEEVNTYVDGGHVIPKAWHTPYITEDELVNFPLRISEKLKQIKAADINEELSSEIIAQAERLEELKVNTTPQLFNGNARYAIPSYLESLRTFESILQQVISWESIDKPNTMPKHLAKRIRSIDAQINKIDPNIEELKGKIDSINDASDTAEKLPIDLQSLKEANLEIENIKTKSNLNLSKIETNKQSSETLKASINTQEVRAKKVAEYCEEVHGIATSVGLSASFSERAEKTSQSMWFWIIALFIALIIIMLLGHNRLENFNDLIKVESPNWGALWMNLFLSILGIAAPGWLAWLSTKQIAQRFKIAEDYKYKAAVAKAYEGYKREAADIDKDLAYRLFDSALTRLEEPPLRLMEQENHGSPFSEFLNSPHMDTLMNKLPELKSIISEAKKGIPLTSQESKSAKRNIDTEKDE